MDMKVTFDSQDMLLKEDFTLPVSICKTRKRKSKMEYMTHVIIVTVSVVTCTVACICATYCHQVLKEITALHESDITKHYQGSPTAPAQLEKAFSSTTSPISGTEDIVEDYSGADHAGFEVEKFESALSRNDDRFIEGPREKFNFNAKKPLRQKRSANEIKKCKKNCRGMNKNDRRACRKKCGGGKPNNVKSSNFIYQINLPAAHFEANMFDDTANHLVNTKYNKIKSRDEGPLKIFKQAQWVNGPSSPFTFSDNSVAKATSSGIFFVYAQAYIGGSEPEKSIIIIQKRNGKEINALSCDNGVNQGSGSSSQMQTCAVSGLLKLEKDDTVEIQRSDVTIHISLDRDKTFFGLVQLSGITATNQ